MSVPMARDHSIRKHGNVQTLALLVCVGLAALASFVHLGAQLDHSIEGRVHAEVAAGADHHGTSSSARPTLGSRASAAVAGGAARAFGHAAEAARVLGAPTWQRQIASALADAPRFVSSTADGIPANLRVRNGSPFMLQEAISELLPLEQRALQISAGRERPITPLSVRTEFQGRSDRFGRVVTLNNENPRALALSPEIEGEFSYVGVKRGIMIGCCGPSGGVCCGVPATAEDFATFLESVNARLEPGGIAVLQGAIDSPFLLTASRKLHVDAAKLFAESNPHTTTFIVSQADGIDSGLAIVNAPLDAFPRIEAFESSEYLRYFLDL